MVQPFAVTVEDYVMMKGKDILFICSVANALEDGKILVRDQALANDIAERIRECVLNSSLSTGEEIRNALKSNELDIRR